MLLHVLSLFRIWTGRLFSCVNSLLPSFRLSETKKTSATLMRNSQQKHRLSHRLVNPGCSRARIRTASVTLTMSPTSAESVFTVIVEKPFCPVTRGQERAIWVLNYVWIMNVLDLWTLWWEKEEAKKTVRIGLKTESMFVASRFKGAFDHFFALQLKTDT